MSISPARHANAVKVLGNCSGLSAWSDIGLGHLANILLEADDLYRAPHIYPVGEPKLPEGVAYHPDNEHWKYEIESPYNKHAWHTFDAQAFTPEMLEAIAAHMRWRSRPKPAPVPEVSYIARKAAWKHLERWNTNTNISGLAGTITDAIADAVEAALVAQQTNTKGTP